jgi:tetratricopeptide (TPR) repeat protein
MEILEYVAVVNEPAMLDYAIDLLRRAHSATHGTDPDVYRVLMMALMTRHGRTGSLADLNEIIDDGRVVVAAVPAGELDWAIATALLAGSLQARYNVTGALNDLDEAISLGRAATDAIPDGTMGQAGSLANLSMTILSRFERTPNPADVEEAISVARRAFAAAGEDDPDKAAVLTSLGNALQARYALTQSLDDLDEALSIQAALAEAPPEDPNRCMYLNNLSNALYSRFAQTENISDLDQAVAVGREAVAATPVAHPNRAVHLRNLGNKLYTRFRQTKALRDLDESIRVYAEALSIAAPGQPYRVALLSQLSKAQADRWEHTHDRGDLDAAVDATRAAAAAAPGGHPERGINLVRLGALLWVRIDLTGSLDDIREAVVACREATASSPTEGFDQGRALGTLAAVLVALFDRVGDLGDLDEAITAGRAAVAELSADDPRRALFLSVVANALRERCQRTGGLADIEEAINLGREAAAVTDSGDARTMILSNLGAALLARNELQGGLDDLDEAITIWRTVLASAPANDVNDLALSRQANARMALSSLGLALGRRYDRRSVWAPRDTSDLEEGVQACREALASSPRDEPFHSAFLVNLSVVLLMWCERDVDLGAWGTLAEMDETVDVSRRAVASVPSSDRRWPLLLMNLARALRNRFIRSRDLADLDEAVDAARQVVSLTAADHPDRCTHLHDLSRFLYARYEQTKDAADVAAAIDGWREAVAVPAAPPATRLYAASCWGAAAMTAGRQWALAADGYASAVELLPLVAWRGLSRADREFWVNDARGLGGDAAACAIAAGRPDRALELLECSRGVIWSQLLDIRSDLAALRAAEPELADELDGTRMGLASGSASRQRAAAYRWDELVEAARVLPGFSSFMRPPTAADLRPAATGGPVVVINVSQWRCDAIVVTTAATEIIPLPKLSRDEAWNKTREYVEAAEELEAEPDRLAAKITAEQVLAEILQWLWDAVAAPILDALGYGEDVQGDGPWPRIWWCPCGPLALLPIHAAGYHNPHGHSGGRSVIDRVVSSYTPTVRTLVTAHTADSGTTAKSLPDRLLMVAMPQTPGFPDLPYVGQERDRLAGIFPADRLTLLEGPAATRDTVGNALVSHRWAHFSCHGDQNLLNPSDAGILVSDGMVTVSDFISGNGSGGEWAFLAACKTATGGLTVTDEAITLTSALLYTGWRHVVGTLWTVIDSTTAELTADVYAELTRQGHLQTDEAAVALHRAVHKIRDAEPRHPSLWVPFVHSGP